MRPFLALLFLAACADSPITSSQTELAVEPAELVFGHVWVGHPEALPLALVNRGRATQAIEVTVEGPFQLDQTPSELTGAARRELQVRFVPVEAGSFEGAIRIGHEGGEVLVPLRGAAEQPPACGDSECHKGLFDPELGACRQVPLGDGTACESVCLDQPSCQQGRCVGKPKSCDDGNVCTIDSCDPVKGCVHVDTTAQCPKPANPCHVAICEPESGCGEADASDYTPCGAVSCAAAHVCFSGSCMEFEPPDGFPCAPATPCQGVGTCKARKCLQPPPGNLPISWTWAPAEKHYRAQLNLADKDGNLYLHERLVGSAQQCANLYPGSQQEIDRCLADFAAARLRILSLTPEGVLRWTLTAPAPFVPLFVDHGRLWVNVANSEIRMLNAADGTLVATIPSTFEQFFAGDRIVIATRRMSSPGDTIVVAFDALDGSQLWMKRYSGEHGAIYRTPALLENDRVMLIVKSEDTAAWGGVELLFLDSAGNELSRSPGPDIAPAISPTRSFPVFYELPGKLTWFDAQSSSFKWQVDPLPDGDGSISGFMVGRDRLVTQISQQPGEGLPYEHRLVSRRLTDGGVDWTVVLPTTSAINELWLSDRSSVVVEQLGGLDRLLAEHRTLDGSLVYSCPLEKTDDVVVIGHGRAFATSDASGVTAYTVPGLGLAKSGWVSREGNPGRSKRPW